MCETPMYYTCILILMSKYLYTHKLHASICIYIYTPVSFYAWFNVSKYLSLLLLFITVQTDSNKNLFCVAIIFK